VEAWKDGEHKNGLTAGNELTEEITNQSPHGIKVLEGLPIVGELVE
jgi:predicted heme/steroid binding protein